jgi:death-on-curing protein
VSKHLAHLTASAVKAIHDEVLAAHGGLAGVRDEALLESAVAAPQATMMGQPLISDPSEIAAAYLFFLCRNRPFLDGNNGTALASGLVFLVENDLLPVEVLPLNEWEALVLDVAAGTLDRSVTTQRFRSLVRALKRIDRRAIRRVDLETQG